MTWRRMSPLVMGGVLVVVVASCGSPPVRSVARGSVTGRLVEAGYSPPPQGDVKQPVPDSTVILTGVGITKSVQTTGAGVFAFSGLAPGRYVLKSGFCGVATMVSVNPGQLAHAGLLCFGAVG